ncbi:hypothetical protein LSAT2_001737 [Lamellibrachia satsuma]|nr:hypothetical protein LSAT2_001737 [Lamellibrachia satsuma]
MVASAKCPICSSCRTQLLLVTVSPGDMMDLGLVYRVFPTATRCHTSLWVSVSSSRCYHGNHLGGARSLVADIDSTGSLAQTNLDNQSVCNVLRECSPGSTKATVAVYNGHLEVTNDKLRHSSCSLAQIEHSLVDVDGQNALSLPLLVVTLARRLPVHLWSLGEGWPASHKTKRL